MAAKRKRKTEFRLVRQGDLTVVPYLQRVPRTDRVRRMTETWDPLKEGILQVAILTDGPLKGAMHVFDGGTRWLAKSAEPDYEFYCAISSMTEREAASATRTFNNEQRRHTAYQAHLVGIAAGFPPDLAMEEAFRRVGVMAEERSSTRKLIAAIKASERILLEAFSASRKLDATLSDEERWEQATVRLVNVLELSREAISGKTAHDADMIQAIAVLWTLNEGGNSLDRKPVRARLIKTLAGQEAASGGGAVGRYRLMAQNAHRTGSYGGSESRGKAMARFIARDYNNRLKPESDLWLLWPRSAKPTYDD